MWTELTEDLLAAKLTGPELNALKTAALKTGQSNVITEAIAQVVDEVRGHIAMHNELESGNTIPSRLLSATLVKLRFALSTRLNLPLFFGPNRQKELDAAEELLKRVAEGKFAIEDPAAADMLEGTAAPSPSVTARPRTHTRADQAGM